MPQFLRLSGRRARAGVSAPGHRRGAILVVTAILLVALMAFTGVAVDMSHLYAERGAVQTSADAAAMAAVKTLMQEPAANADAVARAYVVRNPTPNGAVTVESVQFGVWNPVSRSFTTVATPSSGDAVRVTVTRKVNFMFAAWLGSDNSTVRSTSTAWGLAPVMQTSCGRPWGVNHQDFMTALGLGHWDPLSTAIVRALRDTSDANKKWITIHLGNASSVLANGNYYAFDITDQSGASTYTDNISQCNPLKTGDVHQTEPGVMSGPTTAGLQTLCHTRSPGPCYNAQGKVGVPVSVEIFCIGPELQTTGKKWLEAEGVAGLMVTGYQSDGTLTGFFIHMETHDGPIDQTGTGSTITRALLVQ